MSLKISERLIVKEIETYLIEIKHSILAFISTQKDIQSTSFDKIRFN